MRTPPTLTQESDASDEFFVIIVALLALLIPFMQGVRIALAASGKASHATLARIDRNLAECRALAAMLRERHAAAPPAPRRPRATRRYTIIPRPARAGTSRRPAHIPAPWRTLEL